MSDVINNIEDIQELYPVENGEYILDWDDIVSNFDLSENMIRDHFEDLNKQKVLEFQVLRIQFILDYISSFEVEDIIKYQNIKDTKVIKIIKEYKALSDKSITSMKSEVPNPVEVEERQIDETEVELETKIEVEAQKDIIEEDVIEEEIIEEKEISSLAEKLKKALVNDMVENIPFKENEVLGDIPKPLEVEEEVASNIEIEEKVFEITEEAIVETLDEEIDMEVVNEIISDFALISMEYTPVSNNGLSLLSNKAIPKEVENILVLEKLNKVYISTFRDLEENYIKTLEEVSNVISKEFEESLAL